MTKYKKAKISTKQFKITKNKKSIIIQGTYVSKTSKFFNGKTHDYKIKKGVNVINDPSNPSLRINNDFNKIKLRKNAPYNINYELILNKLISEFDLKILKSEKVSKSNYRKIKYQLREKNINKIIELLNENNNCNTISKLLGVIYIKIYNIKKAIEKNIIYHDDQNIIRFIKRGRRIKYKKEFLNKLDEFITIDKNRFLTIREIKRKFEDYLIKICYEFPKLSLSTFYRIILNKNHLDYRRKTLPEKTIYYSNDDQQKIDRNKVSKLLLYYIHKNYKIIYLDETHICCNLKPKKGLFKKGETPTFAKTNKIDQDSITMLSAISNEKMISYQFFLGSCRGADFYSFLINLIKNNNLLNEEYILVIDNCPSHRNRLYFKAQQYFNILFLPKYGPFINPIEYFFYYLKKEIKKNFYKTKKELIQRIVEIITNLNGRTYSICFKSILKYLKKFIRNEDI